MEKPNKSKNKTKQQTNPKPNNTKESKIFILFLFHASYEIYYKDIYVLFQI